MCLYNLDKKININNEDTEICYVESVFLRNKIEMIYKIVHIVEKQQQSHRPIFCVCILIYVEKHSSSVTISALGV